MTPDVIADTRDIHTVRKAEKAALRSLVTVAKDRNRLADQLTGVTEERNRLDSEAADRALNQGVLMAEVKSLTRQRAWLLASWAVLVAAAVGNAIGWLR